MDVLTRMWRVRRTCLQMLDDRGYLVSQEELNMAKDQFREQWGENPRKDDLAILVPKQDDPTEQVIGRPAFATAMAGAQAAAGGPVGGLAEAACRLTLLATVS